MIALRKTGVGVEPGCVVNGRKALGWQFRINKRWFVVFECLECGKVSASQMSDTRKHSCFCTKITHGQTGTPTFQCWSAMINRCTNKSDIGYRRYGGRGIAVCDRWLNSFSNFLSDMGEKPEGLSLDRINNDGDYEPANCRWADSKTQSRNRAGLRSITYDGETKLVSEWAEEIGIRNRTLKSRLDAGWSVERALGQPLQNQGR